MSAVREFDRFLQRFGGHEGGWHPEDHTQFVRLLSTCRGDVSQAVSAATEAMVWIPPAEVERHAHWWSEYQRLLAAKKEVHA